MKPMCRAAGNLLQQRYQLPYAILSSVTYPLTSPNGSSVILLGHTHGLFILWHGGRPLKISPKSSKQSQAESKSKAVSTTSSQEIITIDLDSDDEPQATQNKQTRTPAPEPAEFEDEEDEFDPRHPYATVVQTLDIPLGTGVLKVATVGEQLGEAARQHIQPTFLREQMLVAIGCADAGVRVLTIPLSPPSAGQKEAGMEKGCGVKITEVPKGLGHRLLAGGIAVGVVKRRDVVDSEGEDEEMEGNEEGGRDGWDVLVASTSPDAGGILLMHRIPINTDGECLMEDGLEVYRRVFLKVPATSLDLQVDEDNGAWNGPKVLVVEAYGLVRIYECTTEESKLEGRWALALCPGNLDSSIPNATQQRVLDARFVLGGRAIAAVLSDGEWGVWDLLSLSESMPQDADGEKTRFTYGGWLSTSALTTKSTKTGTNNSKALAPVTPHTRKVRQDALFAGNNDSRSPSAQQSPAAARSSISILKTSQEGGVAADCCLVAWYGDRTIFIPSLRAHHAAHVSASTSNPSLALVATQDPFSSAGTTPAAFVKQIHTPDPDSLSAGAKLAAMVLPAASQTSAVSRSRLPNIIFVSERAISIVGHPRTAESTAPISRNAGSGPNEAIGSRIANGAVGLLKRGELSLDSVESMLDRLAGRVAGRVMRLSARA